MMISIPINASLSTSDGKSEKLQKRSTQSFSLALRTSFTEGLVMKALGISGRSCLLLPRLVRKNNKKGSDIFNACRGPFPFQIYDILQVRRDEATEVLWDR